MSAEERRRGQQGQQDGPAISARHVVGLGASAFLAGAAGAAIYLIRRRGLHHFDSVAETAAKGAASVPKPRVAAAAPLQAEDETVRGPWTLFRDMNAAIFNRNAAAAPRTVSAAPDAPAPLAAFRAQQQPDKLAVSPRPSVQPVGIGALRKGGSPAPREPQVVPSSSSAAAAEDGSDGPLLAVRALALATAIVAAGAGALVLFVRQALGVTSIAEFSDAMQRLAPSLGQPVAQITSQLPSVPVPETDESAAPPLQKPLPVEDVLNKLLSSSDPVEWLRITRQQLDAEYAEEQSSRRAASIS
ncbi:hypothetical protein MCUN1_003842 [Malassezia cuniculi]|uniref:Transmembrane protein n=1 Tax=Malassezia cuniculi TaxID=948313 RepID=A0AAF0EXN5_9BASI|nr:hypothetical protein MCUN1_003842 [Malassezia cuniculi]